MKKQNQNGITLIALVITIIVLLILAGVSIAMLTGDNGLLTKAQTASDETKQKGAVEKVKLAVAGSWGNDGNINADDLKNNLNSVEGIDKSTIKDSLPMTVTVDGIEVEIENNGRVKNDSEETGILPSTNDTKPYLPSDEFSKVGGTNLDTGLVIKDNNDNSYVWVEVPKTIYANAKSNIDYNNIELDMNKYCDKYGANGNIDVWYDGCGLTEVEYNNLKQTMLKSLYDNGGFWISQYEIGTETLRTAESNPLTTPVSKEGVYPYNWITLGQAQQLASQMNSGSYNSSLLFGIQWDLTLKFIEEKGDKTQEQLQTDSTEWGNCQNSSFDISKGKYSTNDGISYTEVAGKYTKIPSTKVLLTTGATERNSALNIYDLAGNLLEWTIQRNSVIDSPGSVRGGYYYYDGSYPASGRSYNSVNTSLHYIGARLALY